MKAPEPIEMLTPWSRLSHCRMTISLRQRLLEAVGDAMLSVDEGLHMLHMEPKSGFEATEEDLRNCYRIFEGVMKRMSD